MLGAGRILPPVSFEGYPSPEGPSCETARRILRKTNADTSLVILNKCRNQDIGGGLQAEKKGTFEPSRGGGWPKEGRRTRRRGRASDASEPRNLRSGQAEEPPAWPGRGTSDAEASKDRRSGGGFEHSTD